MTKLTTILAAGATALAFGAAALATPIIGEAAPAFENVMDADGNTHSLSDFAGKTVVLEWTNHQCPFVVKHYSTDNMQSLQREATAGDAVWLQVISSAPGKQGHVDAATAKQLNTDRDAAPTATILDESGDMGRMYEAATTPHMFIIDGEGTLVYKGAIDNNSSSDPADVTGADNYVRLAMADMSEGEALAFTDTQPYGCSVKY